jgi:hypothetical protein
MAAANQRVAPPAAEIATGTSSKVSEIWLQARLNIEAQLVLKLSFLMSEESLIGKV